jgi:two-component system cell cycle sensor histidine kinase/response regulator CckA
MRAGTFPSWARQGAVILALAAVYVGSARLGLALALPPEKKATAVWPPSGIALAAILLCGSRVWPGIWIGAFLANLWDYFDAANPFSLTAHFGVSSGIAVGSTLQPLLGAALLRRWIGSPRLLDRAKDVFKFVGVAVSMCLIAATLGVTSLCLGGLAIGTAAPFLWWTWWLGDTAGVLVVTPLLLAWIQPAPPVGGRWCWAEAGLMLGLLLGTSLLVFGQRAPLQAGLSPLPYLTIPFLVWAAFRFGQRGAASTLLLLAAVAVWGTAHGRGPFVQDTLNESLLLLQTFVAVLAVTTLAMAAVLTERRHANEALRESEERYRSLFEANPQPVWVHDRQTLAFLAVNAAAVDHYGYSRDEFLALTLGDIRPPEELTLLQENRSRPAATPESSGVWKHRRKDGTVLDVEICSHELLFDGRRARLVLANDVTARRQVEAARARLIAILEATPDLVAISQVEGPASYLNAAGRRLLGIGSEEVVSLAEHRPEWAQKLILEQAIPTALRVGAWSGETELFNRAGEEIPVSQVLIAHKGPAGAVEFLSTIARDIRGQKHLEGQLRQAQKMEAVGRLAGGVAHDFNNLLTVILGYSEVVLSGLSPDAPLRDVMEQIRMAGQRAARLTRQLLAFSRKQVLQPIVLDLNALLGDLEKMLGRVIGEDIDLVVRPAPGLWRVKADAGQMEQVLMNLVVNARDAMPQGGRLTLETANAELDDTYVHAHAEAHAGEHVLVSVSDTGCGMDSVTKAQVFEPFFTTKGLGQGTGLGLSTVYGIVKQSGGHIEVYSELAKGTTFKVYLPRVEAEPRSNQSSASFSGNSTGSETLLLVEDEDAVRGLASLSLHLSGYKILEARNSAEALRMCEQHPGPIDLLVTDVVMPDMGGRELSARLTCLRPGLKVLYLSGYTDDAVVRHGVLSAEVAFLQKPFTVAALARKVREVLDQATNSKGGNGTAGRPAATSATTANGSDNS